MKLKKLIALSLSAAMLASVTACSAPAPAAEPAPAPAAETPAPAAEEKTEEAAPAAEADAPTAAAIDVRIWDNNQQAGLQEIADDWTAISGIPVKVDVVDWDNYWTQLEAGASGGQMPDVFWMHSNTAQMYMENDLILNLDDYIANDPDMDLSNYYEGIVELYNSNGHQYAIPKDHDTIALLYNQAIFDKYGVDTPKDDWTWEDVYEAAKAITEAGKDDGVYGYAVNTSNNQDGWYNIVYDYGAQVITDDHKDTTIDSAEGKAAMEMLRKILTVAAPQTTLAETGTDSLFQSNLVGMISQGSWMINSFYKAESSADYKWAMLPYADVNGNGACDDGERWSCYNGLGWAASAAVADPDSCYSLIAYFCSKEAQIKQAELGVTMAGYKGVSEEFSNAFGDMDVSAFDRIEKEGKLYFRPYTRNTTVWEDPIGQAGAFLDAWQNPEDAALMETSCDNAAKLIRDAIANE